MPLYPSLEPQKVHRLQVDCLHNLYLEEVGNSNGLPVLFIHGGPGGQCTSDNRRYFDPSRYRVILFDQRGSGRSTPVGCVEENTTLHLVDDIERIRQFLGIERWVLFAGSWGSSLSLLYAQAYPERVLAMVLRGSFLARQRDWLWFIEDGGPRFFPQIWSDVIGAIPDELKDLPITERLHNAVFSDKREVSQRVAMTWQHWGRVMVSRSASVAGFQESEVDKCVSRSRIELHYAKHCYFIRENQVLDEMHKVAKMPIKLIHGQLDWVCSVESSYLLARSVENAELNILDNVGHVAGETGMQNALCDAADSLLMELGQRH